MEQKTEKQLRKEFWKERFGIIVNKIFEVYNIEKSEFSKQVGLDTSTLRHWCRGRSFPEAYSMAKLKGYIGDYIQPFSELDEKMYTVVEKCFGHDHRIAYQKLKTEYPAMNDFLYEVLQFCKESGSGRMLSDLDEISYPKTGKIQAVVFDFDGTLTLKESRRSIWESIWLELGYNVQDCQVLHKRFSNNEITHEEWCKLTEDKFIEKRLHRNMIEKLASDLKLMPGIEETFETLRRKDIKIYIASGAILLVIQEALGKLSCYVDEIRANNFRFDENGYLQHIIGTKNDFEGKAEYIKEIAGRLQISTEDILFVGNSNNDQLAYRSGAKTLCINPQLTNVEVKIVWNDYIATCENLTEILPYIEA